MRFATTGRDLAKRRLQIHGVDAAGMPCDTLIHRIKLRRRIARCYRALKQEAGPGDIKGRGWRGVHHHATLRIAA